MLQKIIRHYSKLPIRLRTETGCDKSDKIVAALSLKSITFRVNNCVIVLIINALKLALRDESSIVAIVQLISYRDIALRKKLIAKDVNVSLILSQVFQQILRMSFESSSWNVYPEFIHSIEISLMISLIKISEKYEILRKSRNFLGKKSLKKFELSACEFL